VYRTKLSDDGGSRKSTAGRSVRAKREALQRCPEEGTANWVHPNKGSKEPENQVALKENLFYEKTRRKTNSQKKKVANEGNGGEHYGRKMIDTGAEILEKARKKKK